MGSSHSSVNFKFYQNYCGLCTKFVHFNCNTSCFYLFIALSETWLSNDFHSSKLGLINYNFVVAIDPHLLALQTWWCSVNCCV